jgi:transposase
MPLHPAAPSFAASLEHSLSAALHEIGVLKHDIGLLKQEISALRRQLGKDSSNSSKPPSSDGLKKKPRIAGSLRGKSGKKAGGQTGHQGGTLRQVAEPDHTQIHDVSHCTHCQAALTAAMLRGVAARQVFDLPAPRLEVTEHQARSYTCQACAGVTHAPFPAGVIAPAQYGERIKGVAVYLNVAQLIPEDRVAEVLSELFGAARICSASIVAWGARKAADFAGLTAHIAGLVAMAPVRHLDETGFRVSGRTQWLHTASTLALTQYRVCEKRGDMPKSLVGGVIVHDHFKPYLKLAGVAHSFCNAHHLRELKALIEIEREPWATKMLRLLQRALAAVHQAVARNKTNLAERITRRINSLYDGIIEKGFAFHQRQPALQRKTGARGRPPRRTGHNLLIRLRDYKAETLRFIADFDVPFTNNLAEQDIRMMKVKMKISGGFRTNDGADIFATLRSVISTARKQGWNMLQTMMAHGDPMRALIRA